MDKKSTAVFFVLCGRVSREFLVKTCFVIFVPFAEKNVQTIGSETDCRTHYMHGIKEGSIEMLEGIINVNAPSRTRFCN